MFSILRGILSDRNLLEAFTYKNNMQIHLPLLAFVFAATMSAADLTGIWEVKLTGGELNAAQRLKLELKEGKYKGKLMGSDLTGSIKGDEIVFECTEESRSCGSLNGKLTGDAIAGEGTIEGISMRWSARRPAAKPAQPTRHDFKPTAYHREFAGDKQPVLRIFPGDTVHTTTVDAGGKDADLT